MARPSRPAGAGGADSRVGDDDVESAELLDAVVHRGLQRVVVAHVDLGGDDAAVQGLDQVGGLGEVLGVAGGAVIFSMS